MYLIYSDTHQQNLHLTFTTGFLSLTHTHTRTNTKIGNLRRSTYNKTGYSAHASRILPTSSLLPPPQSSTFPAQKSLTHQQMKVTKKFKRPFRVHRWLCDDRISLHRIEIYYVFSKETRVPSHRKGGQGVKRLIFVQKTKRSTLFFRWLVFDLPL